MGSSALPRLNPEEQAIYKRIYRAAGRQRETEQFFEGIVPVVLGRNGDHHSFGENTTRLREGTGGLVLEKRGG